MKLHYLLDTNILSEPTKKNPQQAVVDKLLEHHDEIAIAAQVLYELTAGVDLMPESKQKAKIAHYLETFVESTLPILPYDHRAARWHAKQMVCLRSEGITLPFIDAQIAAIAYTNNLVLITRNVNDFRYFNDLNVDNWFID